MDRHGSLYFHYTCFIYTITETKMFKFYINTRRLGVCHQKVNREEPVGKKSPFISPSFSYQFPLFSPPFPHGLNPWKKRWKPLECTTLFNSLGRLVVIPINFIRSHRAPQFAVTKNGNC